MNYQKWLDEQTTWIKEQQKAYQKTCGRYILAVLSGAMAALFALGWFVGGFAIAVQNGFFGLILGLLISLFCILAFRTKAVTKRIIRSDFSTVIPKRQALIRKNWQTSGFIFLPRSCEIRLPERLRKCRVI